LIESIKLNERKFVPVSSARANRFSADRPSQLTSAFNKAYPYYPIVEETARKWLRRMGLPSRDNLERLAEFLGTTPDYLCPSGEQVEEGVPFELNSSNRPEYLGNVKAFEALEPGGQEAISYMLKHLPKRKRPA
jgi:hypothetical protein